MNKLGIIGLGSKTTTYYIEMLNQLYNKKHGEFNTCPFTMININFNEINPFLPNDNININLAISLHAPNDEMRSKIMKVNKVYDIKNLMGAVDYYLERSNKRITFEYILFKNINDNLECARELVKLIGSRTKKISVNLIPYNEVDEFSQYQRSLKETVLKFYDELKKNCINVSIRLEYGSDIEAACGQLRSNQLQ